MRRLSWDSVVAFAEMQQRGGVIRRLRWLILVGVVSLVAPATAAAHLKSGALATDFEARVGSLRPAASGVHARVLDGDLLLELRAAPSRGVVVMGFLGEPFLRFSSRGVEANLASPTAGTTRAIDKSDAVSSGGVKWRRIRSGHVFTWHDNRLRPVPTVRTGSERPHAVGSWSIPLIVDGRRTTLSGTEWFASAPSPWPWLVTGTLFVAAAVFAGRRLSERAHRLVASGLLVAAVGGVMSSWGGIILASDDELPEELFAVAFASITAGFLIAGVAAARGARQLGVMALIGAFAATFAIPLFSIFMHGFVLSALPDLAARITAATAIAGGLSAAAVCAPAVRVLLSADAAVGRQDRHLRGSQQAKKL